MNLVLKITGPGGEVTELPVEDARLEIASRPGHRYELVTNQPLVPPPAGAPAGTSNANNAGMAAAQSLSPRALRIDDDLVLDQLPTGYPVILSQFFSTCTPDASCELIVDVPGREPGLITPQSEPLAAYAQGGFLMYTASPVAVASLPTPPEAESTFNWRPIAGLGGAVAIAASAGGGGSVGSDTVVNSSTPVITGGVQTNSSTPVFTGTADPGDTVRLSMQIAGASGTTTVGYATVVDSTGNWTINTLLDQPASGQFPAGGIQPGQTTLISLVATSATGTSSAVVNDQVVLDVTPPARPELNDTGDFSASTSAALNGVAVLTAEEVSDGVVIDGSAEANSTVRATLTGPGGFELTASAQADEQGRFSIEVDGDQLPLNETLALALVATDTAGNESAALRSDVIVDRVLSDAAVGISGIGDDRPPGLGPVGDATNDTTPTITGTLVGALADDERIEVMRNGEVVGQADIDGSTWTFTDNLNLLPDGPQGQFTYAAQVSDAAGNTGNGGAIGLQSGEQTITVDTTAPAQLVQITSVVDNDGGRPVTVDPGTSTDDLTPVISVALSDVLAPGETLQLVRSQNGTISTVGDASDPDQAGELVFEFDDELSGVGTVVYQAQVVDAAGLASAPSLTYTIQILDPLDNLS